MIALTFSSPRLGWLCLIILGFGGVLAAEPPAGDPKTLMTGRGTLLLKDDFNEPPDKDWKVIAPVWETVDGVLKATHTPPIATNHGPVLQRPLAMKSVVVQVEIKLEGKAHAVLHFNKANGHLCRALLTPEAFYIIRRDSGADKGTRLDTSESPIAPGVWHMLLVELAGGEMVATLDDGKPLIGKRDDLDQDKTALLLEAGGGTAWFRNLRVWQALPNKDWEATHAAIEAPKKPAEPGK